MTKWRVWVNEDNILEIKMDESIGSHSNAAESWAYRTWDPMEPYNEIDVFVERCEHDSIWIERTKVRVTVRAEPVFEARVL